jgi:hypothetical protein
VDSPEGGAIDNPRFTSITGGRRQRLNLAKLGLMAGVDEEEPGDRVRVGARVEPHHQAAGERRQLPFGGLT